MARPWLGLVAAGRVLGLFGRWTVFGSSGVTLVPGPAAARGTMGCVLVSSPVEVSRAEVPRSDVQARGVLGSMVLPTGLRPSLGRALDATWKPCLVLTLTVLDAAATSPAPHSKHLAPSPGPG